MSREVMDIAWIYQRDAEEITVREEGENKPDIIQYCLEITGGSKIRVMCSILDKEGFERVIVFSNTKNMAQRLAENLASKGYSADCLHGDIKQKDREKVMESFRKGALRILVATDVAARGIDVDDVDAIFNYDFPSENEYYIHRIGRTGRAKKNGVAYTFISGDEMPRLRDMARRIKAEIIMMKLDENYNLVPFGNN
jgi:ATP-dependent RNA helicase DeaD